MDTQNWTNSQRAPSIRYRFISPTLTYRSIRPQECPQIVSLHHAVFPRKQVEQTIFAAPQVERYLRTLIAFPQLDQGHFFWGAWYQSDLIGYAHFRALQNTWHLNQVAVLPDFQGRGVGRQLWDQFVELGRKQGYTQLSLDVGQDNHKALSWYRRRGLSVMKTIWTYTKELNGSPPPQFEGEAPQLLGWEQCEASQMAYGFSHFRLRFQKKDWSIGRIGQQYFRMTQQIPKTLEDVLAEIDANRQLLTVSSEPIQSENFEEAGVSFHMQGDLL